MRAAVEMRDALPELGVEGRIGVNTGEVVTGTEERLATGDAVNVAARLEQAAAPGEILIGADTLALVAGAVEVGEVEPLELKGKAEPVGGVPARRACAKLPERRTPRASSGGSGSSSSSSTRGSARESEPRCELVTVVGDAGRRQVAAGRGGLAGVEARVVPAAACPTGRGSPTGRWSR